MHIHILNTTEQCDRLCAFCREMVEASYVPAYRRAAVDMLLGYHDVDHIRRDAEQGRIWAAEQDDGLVGAVTVADGELSRMFVRPDYRGRGLGGQLAGLAIEYARQTGVGKLTAWSVPFARGFYEHLGFVMVDADTLNFLGTRDVPIPYIEMALWPGRPQDVAIERAGSADVEEILKGQRIAFEEQCLLYDDWGIPPVTEQARDVGEYLGRGGIILKAVASGRIVGAVRGSAEDGVCHFARLYVLPEWQGKSIARRLIAGIEEAMGDCHVFSIFTGERSHKNLALYERQGYRQTGRRAPARAPGSSGQYDLVWLEKPSPWPEIRACARRFATE